MRFVTAAPFLVVGFISTSALAHDVGYEHTHEPTAAASGQVTLAVTGGFAVGASLGGDYESCDGANHCLDRKRPTSATLGARAGFQFANGLGIELDVGTFTGLHTRVHRTTTLLGEGPTPVAADVTDDFYASGPTFGANVTYTPVRAPIVFTIALGYAHWFATYHSTRTGSAETDVAPSPRPFAPKKNDPGNEDSTGYELFIPAVRAAYPVTEFLQVGFELAAILGIGEARPLVRDVLPPNPDGSTATKNGRSIGFLPQGKDPESGMETFLLFRPALFARVAF